MISGMNTLVEVISVDINRLTEDLLEDHSARLFSRGGHFNKSQLIPVYFLLISGCYEEDTYNNFLYSLRDDIKKTNRPFAFIDTPLEEPGAAAEYMLSGIDTSCSGSVISGLCGQVNINSDPGRTQLAQKVLGDMLSCSRTDVLDIGMSLVYKFNIVANAIETGTSDDIPIVMYYGNPTPKDVLFLCFMQRSGFDVICVSPDKSCENAFEVCPFADKLQKIELPMSANIKPFPPEACQDQDSYGGIQCRA